MKLNEKYYVFASIYNKYKIFKKYYKENLYNNFYLWSNKNLNIMSFELPKLNYAYDALEPIIDARTMEIHYDKHHRTYYTNLVNALKGTPQENQKIEDILKSVSTLGDPVRNNGGGYYNHILFWNNMAKGMATPSSDMVKAIEGAFGSFDKFKEALSNAGKTRFGSGWNTPKPSAGWL